MVTVARPVDASLARALRVGGGSPTAGDPGILRALQYCGGSHTAADIDAAVARGDLQRWDGERSTIITEIKQTPQQRILLYFLAEGDMAELRGMALGINEWGRALGCTKAQLIGRKGWERTAIVQDGWRFVSIVMEQDL